MREFRINTHSQDLTSNFSELFGLIVEGNNFGWADESEIKRIKEKHNIFSLI
jgi:hypothetical protein